MRARLSSQIPLLCFLSVALIAGVSFTAHPLWGQIAGNSGQIVGQILDPSSASVSGAKVTVRNENTNFSRSATCDQDGRFTVPLLPLGPYEVTVEANGFESAKQEALVALGAAITVNFKLAMGAASSAIQVSANTATADVSDAESKSVLTGLQLADIPQNGQRIQNIIWDTPTGQIEPE